MDDADLLGLAARGRVRFHEPNEYILWQGEPHRLQVFVIQQGTVSLWDETGERVELKDVRGVGDMLGIERYCDAPHCLYSGRSESDVVIYAFPALDFDEFVLKYPHAVQYVAAEGRVTPDYQAGHRAPGSAEHLPARGRGPETALDVPWSRQHRACRKALSRHAIRQASPSSIAAGRARGVLTAETLLAWVAAGGGNAHNRRSRRSWRRPDRVVAGCVGDGRRHRDGQRRCPCASPSRPTGRLTAGFKQSSHPADLALLFGEQPATLLRDIRLASHLHELRELNQRARALTLEYLTGAAAVEWLARLTHLIDAAIVRRHPRVDRREAILPGCWCFCRILGPWRVADEAGAPPARPPGRRR